jgi:hypothetical protein
VFESREAGDQLVKQYLGVFCLEREALGLMGLFPGSLHVEQGICNLGDSEQPDRWRTFSASAAAAYIKDLIASVTDVWKNNEEEEGTFLKFYSAINSSEAPTRLPESGNIADDGWISV